MKRVFVASIGVLLVLLSGMAPVIGQDTPPQVDLALEHLGEEVGQAVTLDQLTTWSWVEEVYNDTSLGCPQPDQAYSQVVTRGFQFDLIYQGQLYDYRVATDGTTVVLCSVLEVTTETVVPATPLPTVAPMPAQPTPVREPVSTPMEATLDAAYEDIQFSVDGQLASEVTVAIIPAVEPGEDVPYFGVQPEHVEFQLVDFPVEFQGIETRISVFPLAQFETLLPEVVTVEAQNLQTLIESCPDLDSQQVLPHLPPVPSVQVFVTNVECLDFENGSGIRYITAFRQDVSPLVNQDLRYIYQGTTDDGEHLLSVSLPVSTLILPDTVNLEDVDFEGFLANWETYRADTVSRLDTQSPEEFTPDLILLDSMVQSFSIGSEDQSETD